MSCEEFIGLATEAVDGGVGPLDSARMAAHMSACSSCARYHRVLNRGLTLVRELPEIEPSPDFIVQLHRRLRAADDEMLQRQRSASSGVLVAFALAGLVAFAAWGPLLLPSGSPGTATAALTSPDNTSVTTIDLATTPLDTEPLELRPDPWDAWFGGAEGGPLHAHGFVASFPGAYEPLIVQPPDEGRGRALLTTLLDE